MTGRGPRSSNSSKGRNAAAGALIATLAVVVLAADQFAKFLAIRNLPVEEPVRVIGDFLIFYLVRNPGAAFSLGEGVTWVFTIALAIVAGVIVWLGFTRVRSRLWAVALGLLLGGVLGNLTDRLFRAPGFGVGHVVDFILTPWMWLGFNPAIYNVADMFIVTMMIGVAVLLVLGIHLDGSRDRGAKDASDPDASADADGASADAGGGPRSPGIVDGETAGPRAEPGDPAED